jgi:hypothetical protein
MLLAGDHGKSLPMALVAHAPGGTTTKDLFFAFSLNIAPGDTRLRRLAFFVAHSDIELTVSWTKLAFADGTFDDAAPLNFKSLTTSH